MKKQLLIAIAALFCLSSVAQRNYGGQPFAWSQKDIKAFDIPFQQTPEIDNLEELEAQDAVTDQYKSAAYRFGVDREVDIDFFEAASFETIKGGTKVYRMGIHCPGALSINFLVDRFYIPEGGKMYVWKADRSEFIGAFTEQSNRDSKIFPVSLLKGEKVVIEYHEPSDVAGLAEIHISQISHGYRTVLRSMEEEKGPYGNSGACNINVNCDEGDPWEDHKGAVALILQGGFSVCTGSLINNTNQDGEPYFITANHCLGNPANWTYVFRHESADCSGNTGPTNMTISGGNLLESGNSADHALILLNEDPDPAWDPYWPGWDNSDDPLVNGGAVGIHHPSGDVKKICFEEDAPSLDNAAGAAVWWIDEWEDGVTEPGSSGSPLYNMQGHFIGQLYGGLAACSGTVNNGQYDYYGRMGVSWSDFEEHLDPANSGVSILDGYPASVLLAVDAQSQGIDGIPELLCSLDPFTPTFTLRNNGEDNLTTATIEYTYNGSAQTPINWTGDLATGETDVIDLEEFIPAASNNNITVNIVSANGAADGNDGNNMANATVDVAETSGPEWTVTILTDEYGYETYWEIHNLDNGTVIASGGNTAVGIDGGGAQTADDTDPGAYANETEYVETVTLPDNDCYEFVIVDDYSDGICCEYGTGSYTVSDANGVLFSGGEFTSEESFARSVQPTSLSEQVLNSAINLYPNPTEDVLNISVSDEAAELVIDIIDITGKVVMADMPLSQRMITLDVSTLNSGMYFLRVYNDEISGVKRFSIK